jgi:hypothetical protein
MIERFVMAKRKRVGRLLKSPARTCLTLMILFGTGLVGQTTNRAKSSASDPAARATHILGMESISKGANGRLSLQEGSLQFQPDEGRDAKIGIASIQNVFCGEQDRQVGGVPMALGQAATPFGGGRVIGLFAHKKFDTLTVQYLDPNGGLHGAIFQLNKGQGQILRSKLQALGARSHELADQAATVSSSGVQQ